MADWRRRMGTAEAQEMYKGRAATAECVSAIALNRGVRQSTVRGLRKMKSVVLWYVLAHNLMRAHALRCAAAQRRGDKELESPAMPALERRSSVAAQTSRG